METEIPEEDFDMTVEQLDDKYNPDGDGSHPCFTRETWREHVAERYTISGYWDWVWYELSSRAP